MDLTYETGLRLLDPHIPPGHPDFDAYTLHKASLRANIKRSRLFGDTSDLKSERSQLIYELNEIGMRAVGTPFSELNREARLAQPPSPAGQAAAPSGEAVAGQQRLLGTHRRTLAILLEQEARHTSAHAPPSIAHGIAEAREQIRQIKRTLRAWGVPAGDEPNDGVS